MVVEITEHARIDDYEALREALEALRDFGTRVAIDDAGAGFASLRHILRLEPEFIKLDRTLIDGIESDRSRQALAAGLISFAERIGATIVAEGIERPAEVGARRARRPLRAGLFLRPSRAAAPAAARGRDRGRLGRGSMSGGNGHKGETPLRFAASWPTTIRRSSTRSAASSRASAASSSSAARATGRRHWN